MAVTMKDIAKIAGISRQAVAAALSDVGTSKVSPETRARVRSIAQSLHYVPNQNAKCLRGGASNTVGIYGVPYVSVLSQSLFHQFSIALDAFGYNLIAGYGIGEEAEEKAIRNLLGRGIDGLIVTTQENPLSKWDLARVPYVFCPPAKVDNFDVVVDHAVGAAEAMRKLIASGRRRTVFLAPYEGGVYGEPTYQKIRGIEEVLRGCGEKLRTLTVEECSGMSERLMARLRELSPEILFCSNDYFAGRMLTLLLNNGFRVPEDMAVVGYDGLSVCDLFAVPLSTVVQPLQKVARTVADLLVKRIRDKNLTPEPAGISLPSYFYPSASCGFDNERLRTLPMYGSHSCLEAIWDNTL